MQSGLAGEVKPGFAVDSEDNFYVGVATEGAEGEKENPLLTEIVTEWGEDDSGEEFAVTAKLDGSTGDVLDYELDDEYTAAVAVNPKDEPANEVDELNTVYADNRANLGGEDATTVAAFGSGGELIQRFGTPGLRNGDGIAVDATSGVVYVADTAARRDRRVRARTARAARGGRRGRVHAGWLQKRLTGGGSVTTLNAQVNPIGADTHYYFEYGTGSCAPVPSACTSVARKAPARRRHRRTGSERGTDEPADGHLRLPDGGVRTHWARPQRRKAFTIVTTASRAARRP